MLPRWRLSWELLLRSFQEFLKIFISLLINLIFSSKPIILVSLIFKCWSIYLLERVKLNSGCWSWMPLDHLQWSYQRTGYLLGGLLKLYMKPFPVSSLKPLTGIKSKQILKSLINQFMTAIISFKLFLRKTQAFL